MPGDRCRRTIARSDDSARCEDLDAVDALTVSRNDRATARVMDLRNIRAIETADRRGRRDGVAADPPKGWSPELRIPRRRNPDVRGLRNSRLCDAGRVNYRGYCWTGVGKRWVRSNVESMSTST
jgi:hypothetical protein